MIFLLCFLIHESFAQNDNFNINNDSNKYIYPIDTCKNLVLTNSSVGYIIEPDYWSLMKNGLGYYKDNGIWKPNDSTIIEFEDSLIKTLCQNKINIFAKDPINYLRQYIGIKDSFGNKLLLVSFTHLLMDFNKIFDSIRYPCLPPFSISFTRYTFEKYGYAFMVIYLIKEREIVLWNNKLANIGGWQK